MTPEKEQEIIAALEKDSHASRVARTSGDVSYPTVWRIADRNAIVWTAGREITGCRLTPDRWAAVIEARRANPDATQQALARKTGVSRSTVGRVVRTRRAAVASAEMMRRGKSRSSMRPGVAYLQ